MAFFNNLIWFLCVVTIISKVQGKSTLVKDNKKRCGVQDGSLLPSHGRFRRSVVENGHWNKKNITYKVLNGPYAMPWQSKPVTLSKARVEELVDQAFAEWAPHCGLTFMKWNASSPRADIVLSFEWENHGDGDSFDGPGNVLAHADYPWKDGSDVHFDNDETWVEEDDPRAAQDDSVTIFYPIALHEIGHALGLHHSYDHDTIMYGSENAHVKHLALEDIKRIRELYGISGDISTATTKKPPPSTEPSTTIFQRPTTTTQSTRMESTDKFPATTTTESTTKMYKLPTTTTQSTMMESPTINERSSTSTTESTTKIFKQPTTTTQSTRIESTTTEKLPATTTTEATTRISRQPISTTTTESTTTKKLPTNTWPWARQVLVLPSNTQLQPINHLLRSRNYPQLPRFRYYPLLPQENLQRNRNYLRLPQLNLQHQRFSPNHRIGRSN